MKINFYTKIVILLVVFIAAITKSIFAQSKTEPVKLSWLDAAPLKPTGVSWGVPWPQGSIRSNAAFILSDAGGKAIPVQSWPLAYWPDGSIKWSAFAAVGDSSLKSATVSIAPGKVMKSMAIRSLVTANDDNLIRINTGTMQCDIAKKGDILIPAITIDGKAIATDGALECLLQNKSDGDIESTAVKQKLTGNIGKVTIEQSGPIRAVIRIEGNFTSANNSPAILPFIVRLYFYAGTQNIRLVHTLIYNADEQKDFIKGLGLTFSVPFREELQNRHVRFSGEGDGIWAEPIQPLAGRRIVIANGINVEPNQSLGKRIPDLKDLATQKTLLREIASWNDYKLVQGSADGFMIQKRTNSASSWLDVIGGKRASGLAFIGDVSGGLGVALKSFWQSYPAALEVTNARTAKANVKIWLWSPYNDAMDLRHYDTVAHGLNSTYEDVQAGYSTPKGVARTSEIMLYPSAGMPTNSELANDAAMTNNTPLLVSSPQCLHQVGALGLWSLPDTSTPGKRWIEGQLDKALAFYKQEVDQRGWYGYWSYGDVMHSYDAERHTWKYDIGGFAWDNTELSTDMWLWYSYLRTGRADIYKMAEAMTRHTSEVDVYHLGPYAGLGSRHNVNHWGDGSKEVRESQAVLRRFYYYLTTDERTGDLMHEVALHADSGLLHVDPLREILPKSQYPTHARVGPDWFGLVGDWMTEWERTGDIKWKNKILVGVNDFAKMPYGFFSGKDAAFGYDPATNHLYMLHPTDFGSEHLATLMGGIEMGMELKTFLNNKDWDKLFVQFCALYGAPAEEMNKAYGKNAKTGEIAGDYARMPAYAAWILKDPVLAKRAWDQFLPTGGGRFGSGGKFDSKLLSGPTVLKPMYEIRNVSTNSTAQWCLNAIELLQLVGDSMPEHNAVWDK